MSAKIEKDTLSGTDTTGHEWDGIRELNTPLPSWWLLVFAICVVWAIGYMVVYPSVPYLWSGGKDYFRGLAGYSDRTAVDQEVAGGRRIHAAAMARIADLSFDEITQSAELKAVALASGRSNFVRNCQLCHGPGGSGRPAFPALASDRWLWGGTLEEIQTTITHGIRSADNQETRESAMPRFGLDQMLTPEQIGQVANYVVSLTTPAKAGTDLSEGKTIFTDNCVSCHGEKAEGSRELGAPRLTGSVWLYGGDREAIMRQVSDPRHGVMPAWGNKFNAAEIKGLALYVHSLGGSE